MNNYMNTLLYVYIIYHNPGPKPTPPGPMIPKLRAHATLLSLVSRSNSRFLREQTALLDLSPTLAFRISSFQTNHFVISTTEYAHLFPQESAFSPGGGYSLPATSVLGSQVHHSF